VKHSLPVSKHALHLWTPLGICVLAVTLVATLFAVGLGRTPSAHAAGLQYDEFWRQDSASAFSAWTPNGVAAASTTSGVSVQLAPDRKATLSCSATDIDGGAARFDARVGLCTGVDPYAPGAYSTPSGGINYYNGGGFYFGTLVSPVHTTAAPFDHLIASWDATTPVGTWLELHVRVLQSGGWTHWYILPIWASDFSAIRRHSVNGQFDGTAGVATDTFVVTNKQTTTAYQLGLTLFSTSPSVTPSVRLISAIASKDDSKYPAITPDSSVWGTNLPVPQRSQMLPQYTGLGFGGGGEVWCSPTSTSMVMAYWSNVLGRANLNQIVPDAAAGTFDYAYDGTGNWPNNTAYAANYGLTGFVTRMYSMSQVEQWIKAGVPIVISIAFNQGQLPGEPVKKSDGHLLVVRGFTATGDVITNDPAASTDAGVQIVYGRSDLEGVWQKASNGTAYVIYPKGWAIPTAKANGSW
jgi:hypothetical protein